MEENQTQTNILNIDEQKADIINNIEKQSIFNRITNNLTQIIAHPLNITEFFATLVVLTTIAYFLTGGIIPVVLGGMFSLLWFIIRTDDFRADNRAFRFMKYVTIFSLCMVFSLGILSAGNVHNPLKTDLLEAKGSISPVFSQSDLQKSFSEIQENFSKLSKSIEESRILSEKQSESMQAIVSNSESLSGMLIEIQSLKSDIIAIKATLDASGSTQKPQSNPSSPIATTVAPVIPTQSPPTKTITETVPTTTPQKTIITNTPSTKIVGVSRYPGCDTDDIIVAQGKWIVSACNVGASKASLYAQCKDEASCTKEIVGDYFKWGNNTPFGLLGKSVEASTGSMVWGDESKGVYVQGPCSSGYHVPGEKEFIGALDQVVDGSNNTKDIFPKLKIPLAGLKTTGISYRNNLSYAYFHYQKSAYEIQIVTDGRYSTRNDANNEDNNIGLSIRCFKD